MGGISAKAIAVLVAVAAVFLLFIHITPPASRQDATTSLLLLDVTSEGAGKYGTNTESYWGTRNGQSIIRCYHYLDYPSNLSGWPTNCEKFAEPADVPSGSTLLALNMGAGQKTQSVWDIHDHNKLFICDHDRDWLTSSVKSSAQCTDFVRPQAVNSDAILATMNSGQNIAAQSFWNNPDGTITVCRHDKDSSGFLGLGDKSFGQVRNCTGMSIPTHLFPATLKNPKLAAITSDAKRPWEVFWQDDDV